MAKRYRVNVVESERGWGQDYWHREFDTYDEAVDYYNDVNGDNPDGPAPSYYIQANDLIDMHDNKKVLHREKIIKRPDLFSPTGRKSAS